MTDSKDINLLNRIRSNPGAPMRARGNYNEWLRIEKLWKDGLIRNRPKLDSPFRFWITKKGEEYLREATRPISDSFRITER